MKVPVLPIASVAVGMKHYYVALGILFEFAVYFYFFPKYFGHLGLPLNFIAKGVFIGIWVKIHNVGNNFLVPFFLTEVYFLFLDVICLVDLNGDLAESESVGAEGLMLELGRYIAKEVDL